MTKFDELLGNIKSQLKSFVSNDMSPEQLNTIAEMDKALDQMNDSHNEVVGENTKLKDSLIESIKNTGFKSGANENDDIGTTGETKSLDEIMIDELAKIQAK